MLFSLDYLHANRIGIKMMQNHYWQELQTSCSPTFCFSSERSNFSTIFKTDFTNSSYSKRFRLWREEFTTRKASSAKRESFKTKKNNKLQNLVLKSLSIKYYDAYRHTCIFRYRNYYVNCEVFKQQNVATSLNY